MAKPRTTRSARISKLNRDAGRVPQPPSVSVTGTVNKIIPARGRSKPEQAQIAIDDADPSYQALRIENVLMDERGDDVRLKSGAHVQVTVGPLPKR